MFLVRVFEVAKPPTGPVKGQPQAPRETRGFQVDETDVDAAKRAVKRRFAESATEVRSLNVSANGRDDTLVAYVTARPGGS